MSLKTGLLHGLSSVLAVIELREPQSSVAVYFVESFTRN
jgi:hypothetical protein